MIDGILNIKKEKGFTSHDVVAKLRGILHQKKIGHTGTLDPEATGVLPVCLGKGTRLCELLADDDKTYETVLRLGVTTDTQDLTGTVLSEAPVTVTEEQVTEVIRSFLGEQQQVPPMYSALKHNGKKLYELARQGIEVERPARPVHFYALEILELNLPRVKLRVNCSKGTYIRTLCHDIGAALGCGGAMEELVRTSVGQFRIGDALTLSETETLFSKDRLGDKIFAVEQIFRALPSCAGRTEADKLLHNGNPIAPALLAETNEETLPQGRVRMYDSAGTFIGIFEYQRGKNRYFPVKMFY